MLEIYIIKLIRTIRDVCLVQTKNGIDVHADPHFGMKAEKEVSGTTVSIMTQGLLQDKQPRPLRSRRSLT
ncbi:hypothetical protein J6590_102106 [Homalodisca vitripennis]|nr:hypothetical protein J6590_102106 [Homalodisca vitripennis]